MNDRLAFQVFRAMYNSLILFQTNLLTWLENFTLCAFLLPKLGKILTGRCSWDNREKRKWGSHGSVICSLSDLITHLTTIALS